MSLYPFQNHSFSENIFWYSMDIHTWHLPISAKNTLSSTLSYAHQEKSVSSFVVGMNECDP